MKENIRRHESECTRICTEMNLQINRKNKVDQQTKVERLALQKDAKIAEHTHRKLSKQLELITKQKKKSSANDLRNNNKNENGKKKTNVYNTDTGAGNDVIHSGGGSHYDDDDDDDDEMSDDGDDALLGNDCRLSLAASRRSLDSVRVILAPSEYAPLFLRLMLGNGFQPVVASSVERLRLKEEYYRFRDRSTLVFLLFPLLLLLLAPTLSERNLINPAVQLHEAWLLYFYTALAMRENILVANGSNIRKWWIRHHYLALALVLVQLTSPFSEWRMQFADRVHRWAVMQAVVMLLQNRFQRRKLYTAIALGKARPLDVVAGESSAYAGMMWLLYPALFALQASQMHTGMLLALHCVAKGYGGADWQAVACCALWIAMGIGNIWTTGITLSHKLRAARRGGIDAGDVDGMPSSTTTTSSPATTEETDSPSTGAGTSPLSPNLAKRKKKAV